MGDGHLRMPRLWQNGRRTRGVSIRRQDTRPLAHDRVAAPPPRHAASRRAHARGRPRDPWPLAYGSSGRICGPPARCPGGHIRWSAAQRNGCEGRARENAAQWAAVAAAMTRQAWTRRCAALLHAVAVAEAVVEARPHHHPVNVRRLTFSMAMFLDSRRSAAACSRSSCSCSSSARYRACLRRDWRTSSPSVGTQHMLVSLTPKDANES